MIASLEAALLAMLDDDRMDIGLEAFIAKTREYPAEARAEYLERALREIVLTRICEA